MTIQINTPVGAPPRKLFMKVVGQVFDRVMDTAAHGDQPPQLHPSIALARAAQERDDVQAVVRHLLEIAVAAIFSIVRVLAAEEEPPA